MHRYSRCRVTKHRLHTVCSAHRTDPQSYYATWEACCLHCICEATITVWLVPAINTYGECGQRQRDSIICWEKMREDGLSSIWTYYCSLAETPSQQQCLQFYLSAIKTAKMATYNFISSAEFFRVAVIWAACPQREGWREKAATTHESPMIRLFLASEEVPGLGSSRHTSNDE